MAVKAPITGNTHFLSLIWEAMASWRNQVRRPAPTPMAAPVPMWIPKTLKSRWVFVEAFGQRQRKLEFLFGTHCPYWWMFAESGHLWPVDSRKWAFWLDQWTRATERERKHGRKLPQFDILETMEDGWSSFLTCCLSSLSNCSPAGSPLLWRSLENREWWVVTRIPKRTAGCIR